MNKYKFSDTRIGLEESFEVKIDVSKMDKFLDISNDINPLHIDREYAKEKGFIDRVVYGLLTSSFYSTLVGVYLPGKYCILQGIDIQFSKPVYIDDTLKVSGKITYINEAYKQIEIKAIIINQENQKVSKATIKVGVMDE
ncbi:dehydratase [Sulfurimonas sp. SAG-AH-194-I05]|nr:MaoC/PaaZ C-terminal domain-containing protein [Sulfurimonas sp. SAG-AH-194-I05]MDF1876055.1 dehydratase [Sulfurimonas sp. SAG-AH-194-I05]